MWTEAKKENKIKGQIYSQALPFPTQAKCQKRLNFDTTTATGLYISLLSLLAVSLCAHYGHFWFMITPLSTETLPNEPRR